MSVVVPVIDIHDLFGDDQEKRLNVAKKIGKAAEDIGFMVLVGHGVDQTIINNAWQATRDFFDTSMENKLQYTKPQEEYPFGYNEMGVEVLSAGKAAEQGTVETAPADLKEMFSIGPKDPNAGFPPRLFPTDPASFAGAWDAYYDALAQLATHVLRGFALAMGLEDEFFFNQFIDHHASALRGINYPVVKTESVLPGQLRASAHTDYGTITILKTDGPGLQVSKDKNPPTWYDVPHVSDGFVINLGDLMRRWTNDRWLSTLHRVVIPTSEVSTAWESKRQTDDGPVVVQESNEADAEARKVHMTSRRQSMAFFHNLNKDAVVKCILKSPDEVAKHQPIVAGDFLMQKHLASMSTKK